MKRADAIIFIPLRENKWHILCQKLKQKKNSKSKIRYLQFATNK